MATLTINGLTVPVAADGGLDFQPDAVGAGVTRAQDGSARNNFNAIKKHLSGKSTPLTQTDAIFLMTLILGLGDHWTFDTAGEAYSDKGAGWTGAPTLPTGVTLVTATPTPKRGARALQIDANAAHSIVFAQDPLSDGWTVAVWYSLAAAAFDFWIVSGTGTVASGGAVTLATKNGVAQAATMPAWMAVDASANTVTLKGVAGGTGTFDDLVVIPAPISSTIAADLNTFTGSGGSSQAWPSPYPSLLVGGDFNPVTLTMVGKFGRASNLMGALSGAAFANTLRKLEFELLEA